MFLENAWAYAYQNIEKLAFLETHHLFSEKVSFLENDGIYRAYA